MALRSPPPSRRSSSARRPASPRSRQRAVRPTSRRVPAAADMGDPPHPSLYQINTRVCLTELARALGRAATLDDIPDAELDRVAGRGFGWVWLLSVWSTGPAGQRISRANPEWRREFEETLP